VLRELGDVLEAPLRVVLIGCINIQNLVLQNDRSRQCGGMDCKKDSMDCTLLSGVRFPRTRRPFDRSPSAGRDLLCVCLIRPDILPTSCVPAAEIFTRLWICRPITIFEMPRAKAV
jgi:hypothetical protein